MRLNHIRSFVASCALLLSAGVARADMTSPYESWAKVKPGSSVTIKSLTEAAGQKSESHLTYTLKEVTPDKAVIELKTSMVIQGNKMDLPATTMNIPKGSGGSVGQTKPIDTPNAKTSEETVKIGGKEYKCMVTEVNTDANGMKVKSKSWLSSDVPNLLVKTDTSTEGTVASKTSMEVESVDLK